MIVPLFAAILLICYLFLPLLHTNLLSPTEVLSGSSVISHLNDLFQTATHLKQLGFLLIGIGFLALLPTLGGILATLGATLQKHRLTLWGSRIAIVGLVSLFAVLVGITLAFSAESGDNLNFFSVFGNVLAQSSFGIWIPLIGFSAVSAYAKVNCKRMKETKEN